MRALSWQSALTSPPHSAAGPLLSRFAGEDNVHDLQLVFLASPKEDARVKRGHDEKKEAN